MKKNFLMMGMIFFFFLGCGGVKSNVILPYQPDLNIKFRYSLSANQLIEVPNEVLENMRTQLDKKLSEGDLLATENESKFRKVDILITEYRMRHGAARALAGIFAGCDTIKTKVAIMNVNNEKAIGESHFESNNCTALGTSDGLIEDHINKIAEYLSGN